MIQNIKKKMYNKNKTNVFVDLYDNLVYNLPIDIDEEK